MKVGLIPLYHGDGNETGIPYTVVNISITVNVTEEESDRELTFQITKEGLAVRNVTIRAFTLSGSAQGMGRNLSPLYPLHGPSPLDPGD